MDYGFVSSPSQSPRQAIFAHPQYFDSTSESSSPSSPHINQMMFNNTSMPFDNFQYGNNSPSFYTPQPARIPVDYSGASSVDETDRRRRRSGSSSTTSKDKDSVSHVHLVSLMSDMPPFI